MEHIKPDSKIIVPTNFALLQRHELWNVTKCSVSESFLAFSPQPENRDKLLVIGEYRHQK